VTRPLIAVPGVPLKPGAVRTWRQGGYGVPAPYLEALDRAGADGAVLMPSVLQDRAAAEVLARFDGLLLPGGGDIDPALYGEEAVPEVAYVSPARDGYEIPVVRHAVESGLPTLAICRGVQVLNVALGGTLHQHISDREGLIPHRTDDGDAGVMHSVQVEAGSRLAEVLGATEVDGYSHHHQALDRIAPGLRVVATAPDGTVEAVETEAGWVIGIQWHAEATAATDPVQQRLFGAFADAVAGARR
jgi:putative glutamine amidotransferase